MTERRRAYRSALRAEQAERTRAAVIAAATECFLGQGYAETTMKDIAERAGVSAPTVYAQGSKAALLLTVVDETTAGDAAPEPLIQRDPFQRLLAECDKERKLRLLRGIAQDWVPRIGPVMRVFREAAAVDPEIGEAWEEYERRRYTDMRVIVESFSGMLRPGLTVERATDIYWATFTTQTAEAFMVGRKWELGDYADWLADAVDRLLLR
ncbi:TetR/AcrR family transcriptional regulator [Nonomuraea basaltis]|uniref:TetR/AcrR family transcriptional regulator n=1 Tax=Nonomuraea basaltis TaxID=2495887 RepID=UPI00110C3F35|nr:TetR/AcrR family transcriptional regulator [Nonomuraea basaltis]TMR95228.1 TetR/AcrR family transcriptional regulator [Nonomuraea basaltis]